jgi:hypothetical protein
VFFSTNTIAPTIIASTTTSQPPAEHPNDVADDHELVASDPAGPDAFNP